MVDVYLQARPDGAAAKQSHEETQVREWGMRKFKSVGQAQRFLGAYAAVSSLINLGRHQLIMSQLSTEMCRIDEHSPPRHAR